MTDTQPTERDNDSLCTPEWILERVRRLHPIGLDPCGNPWSTVGARITWSKHAGEDGNVGRNWEQPLTPGESIWVNPPYSDPMPWAMHFRDAADARCRPAFMLVKNDPSTQWSAVLRSVRTAQCDFTKRVRFEGGAHATGMFTSTLFYVGPKPWLFCHEFADVGDVRVCR